MKPMRALTVLLTAGCLTLLVGCGDEEDDAKEMTVETRTGPVVLRYNDLEPGKGEPVKKGDMILFHYTGWTQGGSKLHSSHDKGKAARLTVGDTKSGLIGWHEGVVGMKAGGKRKLFIPPELAFKDQGSPDGKVKPNAKVVYELEVVKIIANPDEVDLDFLDER